MKRKPMRANPPVCWECGRKLYAGGWVYVEIPSMDGGTRPAHRQCAIDAGHKDAQ